MGPATQQLMAAMAPASQATDQGPIDTTAPFLPESVSNFISRYAADNISPADMLGKYYSVISGGVISPEPKEVEKVDPYTNPGLTEEEKRMGVTPSFQPPTIDTAPTSLPAAEQLKGLPGFKPVEQSPEDLIMRSEELSDTAREALAALKKQTTEYEEPFETKFPPITNWETISLGPMAGPVRPIESGKTLFSEMSPSRLENILRDDRLLTPRNMYASDTPDLALGQGENQGIMVQFRPNSISGRVDPTKPLAQGSEFIVEATAPRAIQSITLLNPKINLARGMSATSMGVLRKEFSKVELPDGKVQYIRKGLEDFVQNESRVTDQPASQIDTKEFKNWFGKSKVVDDSGQPLVVYKGMPSADWRTGEQITEIRSASGPWAGFFTSDKEVASKFAEAFGEGAITVPAYLSMKKPFVVDAKGGMARDFMFDASVLGKSDYLPARKALESGSMTV